MGYCVIIVSFDAADLCRVGVKSDARRNGTGGMLLGEAKKLLAAKNVVRFMLEVRDSNNAAINLYQKNNFKEIGKRKGYYTSPVEDAVIMECILPDGGA